MKAIRYIAFAATLLSANASNAADLNVYKAPPTAQSWTGFYVGGDVGLRGATAQAATRSIFETATGFDTCENGSNCFFDEHLKPGSAK